MTIVVQILGSTQGHMPQSAHDTLVANAAPRIISFHYVQRRHLQPMTNEHRVPLVRGNKKEPKRKPDDLAELTQLYLRLSPMGRASLMKAANAFLKTDQELVLGLGGKRVESDIDK